MTGKKTTTTLDNETHYFLHHIALIKLEKENIFYNKIYDIITLVFNEVSIMIDKDLIDFKDEHLLKNIDNSNNKSIFFILTETHNKVINAFQNNIENSNKLNLKRNQIIKTIVIFYYKSLIK